MRFHSIRWKSAYLMVLVRQFPELHPWRVFFFINTFFPLKFFLICFFFRHSYFKHNSTSSFWPSRGTSGGRWSRKWRVCWRTAVARGLPTFLYAIDSQQFSFPFLWPSCLFLFFPFSKVTVFLVQLILRMIWLLLHFLIKEPLLGIGIEISRPRRRQKDLFEFISQMIRICKGHLLFYLSHLGI